jgi:hypothetical protein
MMTKIEQEKVPDESQVQGVKLIMPEVKITKPTSLEVFLGQYFDKRKDLQEQLESADRLLLNLDANRPYIELADLLGYRNNLQKALDAYQISSKQLWLYQWSLLFLLVLTGGAEAIFIHLYSLWHGANFISLSLYTQNNIDTLAKIGFVGGATTMSVAAEVLMWSSLGTWAQQSFEHASLMQKRLFKFVDDGLGYVGTMMRTTSIAAIIVIILRLTKFSIFGVSLDETSPLAFDATIGVSFLLGFFGNDSYKLLSKARQALLGKAFTNDNDNQQQNV